MWPDGKPPFPHFAKLRKEFGEEIAVEMLKRIYLAEKTVEGDLKSYLTGACIHEQKRRKEQSAECEITLPVPYKHKFGDEE